MKVVFLLISLASCVIADGDHHHHAEHHDDHHQSHDTQGEHHSPTDHHQQALSTNFELHSDADHHHQALNNHLDQDTFVQNTLPELTPSVETSSSSYSSYEGAAVPKVNDFKFVPTKKPVSVPAQKPFPVNSSKPEKTESTGMLNFAKDWDWKIILAVVLVAIVSLPVLTALIVEIKTIKSVGRDLDISNHIEDFIYNAQTVYEAIKNEY